MKQHITKLSILLFLVFAAVFNSCETEKDFLDNKKETNYQVKRLTYSDFVKNQTLVNKINKVGKKQSGSLQRKIHFDDYGFSINTEDFLFIGNDSIHTYTFNIEKENEDSFVENLVLQHLGNNDYNAYLVRYNLTETEKEDIREGRPIQNYLDKAQFAYLPDIDGSFFRSTVYTTTECRDVIIRQDYSEWYDDNGVGHWDLINYYEVVCEEITHVVQIIDGGGNPGGGTIPTNPNSSGGGGSDGGSTGNPPNNSENPSNPNPDINDGNNPIITTPVLPGKSTPKPPCEHLKNQSIDNPKISAKIDSLKQRVLPTTPNFDTKETMVNVERFNDEYHIFVSNNATTGNGTTNVTGGLTKGDVARIHNHPINTIPIFSHVDIVEHFDAYNFVLGSRKNEFTDYLVNFNNTTYALRMENIAALTALFEGLDLNTKEGKIDANNRVFEIFETYGLRRKSNPPYTQAMAETLFMNVVNDPKMGGGNGIALYRKDDDGWGKLVKTGNTIQKTPCN
ncbi:MAG: hypothetical protein ACOVMG_06950 [Flavobacterium sp.]